MKSSEGKEFLVLLNYLSNKPYMSLRSADPKPKVTAFGIFPLNATSRTRPPNNIYI
jgi:hypothetical protein